MINDFLSMIFPRVCNACGNALFKGEEVICTFCTYHLPKTGFWYRHDNPVARNFWGKVRLESASAFYYFYKGNRVQHLVHRLKYKGGTDVGEKIGNLYGSELARIPLYRQIQAVVPVPLHQSRIMKRGYNQSDFIAKGIASALGIHAETNLLVRSRKTETQTKKKRFHRFENMSSVFEVNKNNTSTAKIFLLVDDVITTGSTLASCADELLKIPGAKVSIGALAYAAR
jgi:ComF family protein